MAASAHVPENETSGGVARAALPWLAGTLAVHQLPALPHAAWFVPLALLALVALRMRRLRWLVFLAGGFAWTAWCAQARLDDVLPAELVGADLPVAGWVDAFPSDSPDRVRLSLRVTEANGAAVPRRLRLTWYDPPHSIAAGSELELVVRLRRPRGLVNPGGFDYERWLYVEGYGATGYVRSGTLAAGGTGAGGLPRRWMALRARLAERIDAAAPSPDASALLTALTLGERFRFEERHWTSLRRTGTTHLVAISGLHVGLVAALVFVLVQRLWLTLPAWAAVRDLEASALAALLGATAYAALAGFAVPTQRALVMVAVALAMLVARRHVGLFDGLSVALLLVLIWDPLAPLAASFWLSFLAVTVLLMMAARREPGAPPDTRSRRALRALRLAVRLQWGVTLALVPPVAMFFGELSLVAPVVNLLAIPFFSFVLVPLTLLAACAASLHAAGDLLLDASGWLAIGVWHALAVAGAPDWAAVTVPAPALAAFVLASLAVLAATPAHALPARSLAWLALLPLVFAHPPRPPDPGSVRAIVLDVGHGLAVLIETHRHRLLYDAGPAFPTGYDTGTEVVLPALEARGVLRLDRVVVSHDHNDHTGGVASTLAAFPDADVLAGPDVERFGGEPCVAGSSWRWDEIEFAVLHPAPGFEPLGNESSCVLKVSAPGGALLVTGDIEARAERVLRDADEVAAEVVVVPHHGSATSSSAAFIAATRAELAIVSTDYYSRWRFPRPEVRERWQAAGARVLVTGESGAVTVEIGPRGVAARAAREGRRRYWSAQKTPWLEALQRAAAGLRNEESFPGESGPAAL